jgi:hypothetical protein
MTSHICLGWKQDHYLLWLLCRSYTYWHPTFHPDCLKDFPSLRAQLLRIRVWNSLHNNDAIYLASIRRLLRLLTEIVASVQPRI